MALFALCCLILGAVVGIVARRWLSTLAYRYEDEADLRVPGHAWVVPCTAAAFAAVGAGQYAVGGVGQGLAMAVLTGPLVVLAAIDRDVHRLPDRWTGPTAVAALGLLTTVAGFAGRWRELLVGLVVALVVGLFYLLLAVIAGGSGFGLGDVKLAPTLGLLLGFNGTAQAVLGVFLGFVSAALVGVVVALRTHGGRKTVIAFGPHMVVGTLVLLSLPAIGAVTGG